MDCDIVVSEVRSPVTLRYYTYYPTFLVKGIDTIIFPVII